MVFDEASTARIRQALAALDGITEQRMMGGICFMLHGNMIGGADRTKDSISRFMFRVGKNNQAEAATLPGAIPMEMGGRHMRGFFFVEEAGCDGAELNRWLGLALEFVGSLPPKGEQ